VKRVTLTYGARYDYLNASVPDETNPADASCGADVEGHLVLPCWNDWASVWAAPTSLRQRQDRIEGIGRQVRGVDGGRYRGEHQSDAVADRLPPVDRSR